MFYIIIFLFGLVVGSFLNCIIYRLHTNESFWKGHSQCPHCKHILGWQDLIPVLGFLILKGKCRYCQQKISLQYPLVELAAGFLFVSIINYQLSQKEILWLPTGQAIFNQFSIFNFQFLLSTLYFLIISCFLIIIFVYDLKHYIIPDKVIYPAIGLTFLYQLFRIWNFGNWDLFGIWDLGFGILPALFFLTIIIFSRGQWMGFGDFKLAILMGLFLGFPNILVALFLSFFIGAIIGTALIILKRKKLKSEVAFGPFLVASTFIALFWGGAIIDWYLRLFIG